jgi:hypothetical protein
VPALVFRYRKVVDTNYGDLQARVLAFEALAVHLGHEYRIEPAFMHLETLEWSRVVAVKTENVLPFKELLECSISEVYEFIRKSNECYLEKTGRKQK